MRRLVLVGPCDAPWERMRGAGAARHCASCDRLVHDLSALTEPEALAVVILGEGPSRCVRFASDARDRIVHAAAPQASFARSSLRVGLAVAAIGALGTACAPPPTLAPPAPALAPGRPDAPEPEPPSAAVAAMPVPAPESQVRRIVSESQGIMILRYISFPFASRVPTAESKELLEQTVVVLEKNPQLARVAVVGHASKDEPEPKRLGERRAQAVVAALVAAKIDPGRLVVESAGRDVPLADNATPDGRALNRRVQFRIVEAASCPASGATSP